MIDTGDDGGESVCNTCPGSCGAPMSEREHAPKRDTAHEEGRRPAKSGVAAVVKRAAQQFFELTAKQPEGVTGVRKSDTGWSVLLDVVELERVPSTTTVIATYRIEVDEDGELMGYERLRRYVRGAVDPT
ncbi:gas vesicle protein [Actinopolymorpha pittospori]